MKVLAKGGPSPKATGISPQDALADYRLAYRSRVVSTLGRSEVLSGKATFGIFGDGKEVPQVALARVFRSGDWRAGYYRDQTLLLALGLTTEREMFAHLYADPISERCGSRQMPCHFAVRFLDEAGLVLNTTSSYNSSADLSPVAGYMPRLLGLAYASKLYRDSPSLSGVAKDFSNNGDEVAYGTIGDASTSEGLFFETINAGGVLQVPLVMSVWDDGYGISVPVELQTTKGSISAVLAGFESDGSTGWDMHTVPGWDYPGLRSTYAAAAARARREHRPALVHVTELTQPLGHSTSGSHERYKSNERLEWEGAHDCLPRMRQWLVESAYATAEELDAWEAEDNAAVKHARDAAWNAHVTEIASDASALAERIADLGDAIADADLAAITGELAAVRTRGKVFSIGFQAVTKTSLASSPKMDQLADWLSEYRSLNERRYRSHLYSESARSPLLVDLEGPTYSDDAQVVDGRIILRECFDANFTRDPRLFVLGEDVGRLGDVNLAFEGLAAKHGALRVTDTGIREATILGQAVGAAMRGLRPIADIQYVDYFLYAFATASDDLATLHWRTRGGQAAPVVVRTKGHRLVGVWHAGSPMSLLLNGCRGMYLCVPRNMTQAAGMYNTLFRADNPAIVVETLNAYRLKERLPQNIGSFTVGLGRPEILTAGSDVTLITYGACCRVAIDAASSLAELGVACEIIDVQTLNPFDPEGVVANSIEKTRAAVFVDEDVPGGCTAFMMQQVLERQGAWWCLDAPPRCITAAENRPAYGSDGDYFTKPTVEGVVLSAYELMRERQPEKFPALGLH